MVMQENRSKMTTDKELELEDQLESLQDKLGDLQDETIGQNINPQTRRVMILKTQRELSKTRNELLKGKES